MAQIFPRWTNYIPHAVGGGLPVLGLVIIGAVAYWFSPRFTDVGYQPRQPLKFSHRQHAGKLGLDCRFCHNTVERSGYSAVPPTETCMTCHRHVLKNDPRTAKLRASYATRRPIQWVRVHMLPDYAFFNHRVHLAAGVGCQSCHGRIDRMEVVSQAEPLSMGWCLDCHRRPGPHLRPVQEVTNMRWSGRPGQDSTIQRTLAPPLHCSGCHR
ncbi:MAG: cytochrome c3 family protein [bacterium]